MITLDYEGGGGVLANDYVIKNIRIFRKFLLNFGQILSDSNFFVAIINW